MQSLIPLFLIKGLLVSLIFNIFIFPFIDQRISKRSTFVVGFYHQRVLPKQQKSKSSINFIASYSNPIVKAARLRQWLRDTILSVSQVDDESTSEEYFDLDEENHESLPLDVVQRETLSYLQEQFSLLSRGMDRINFETLCSWEEINHLFQEEALSRKELKKIYLRYSSNLFEISNEAGISFEQFVQINYDIDDLIEFSGELTSQQYPNKSFTNPNISTNRPLDHEFLQQFADTFVKNLSVESESNETIIRLPPEDQVPRDLLHSEYEQMNLSDEEYDIIMEKIIASKNFHDPSLLASNENLPLSDNIPISCGRDTFDEEYQDDYSDHNDYGVSMITPPLEDARLEKKNHNKGSSLVQEEENEEDEAMYTDSIEAEEGIVSSPKKSKKSKAKRDNISTNGGGSHHDFDNEEGSDEKGKEEEEDDEENESFNENELSGMDIKDVNVWDYQIHATDLFQKEFLQYLKDFYHSQIEKNQFHLLSFAKFSQWEDIQGLMEENHLDEKILKNLWIEATEYERLRFGLEKKLPSTSTTTPSSSGTKRRHEKSNITSSDRFEIDQRNNNTKTSKDTILIEMTDKFASTNLLTVSYYPQIPKKNEKTLLLIHLDTFIRLNYRLEQVIEDVQEVYDQFIHQESNQPFLEAFIRLTAHHQVYNNPNYNLKQDPIITYEEILHWDYIQELIAKELLEIEDLESFYQRFPLEKQYLQVPTNKTTTIDRSHLPPELQHWPRMVKTAELKEIRGLNRDKFLFFCMKLKEKISMRNPCNPSLSLLATQPSISPGNDDTSSSREETNSSINNYPTDTPPILE